MTANSLEVVPPSQEPRPSARVERLAHHLDINLIDLQQQILDDRTELVESIQQNNQALETLGLPSQADAGSIRTELRKLHDYLQERTDIIGQKKAFMDRWYAAPLRWARDGISFAYDQVVNHPTRTAIIVGGVVLGWYFRHFLIAYLHELVSGAPQAELETAMGNDAAIRGPDAIINPVPNTPTPAATDIRVPMNPPLSTGDLPPPPMDVPPNIPPALPPRGLGR